MFPKATEPAATTPTTTTPPKEPAKKETAKAPAPKQGTLGDADDFLNGIPGPTTK